MTSSTVTPLRCSSSRAIAGDSSWPRYGATGPFREAGPDLHVAPAELRRVEHPSAVPVHHPRDHHADPLAASFRCVGPEQAAHPDSQLVEQLFGVEPGPEALQGDLLAA